MRDYLLISGGWLAAAAVTAFVYVRLATYGAGSDAHHFEPQPLPRARRGRRSATVAVPAWVLAPVALGCVAAVLMADFALAPEGVPSVPAAAPSQSVRMAEVPATRSRRAARKPRRAPARQVSSAAPVTASVPVVATPPVFAAPRFVSTSPAAPAARRSPARRRRAPATRPSPAPAPAAPTAVAAAEPTPTPTPAPVKAARSQPEPAPSPVLDSGPDGPPAHARGAEKRTVHPPSKLVPGRVHRPKAPVGRPRCACR